MLGAVEALAAGHKDPAMTAIKALALQGKWPTPCPPASFEGTAGRLRAVRDGLGPERRGEEFFKASRTLRDVNTPGLEHC